MKTLPIIALLSGTANGAKVTCKVLTDNFLDEVYLDDTKIDHPHTAWNQHGTFTFESSDYDTMALKVRDGEKGCDTGGFWMTCKSDDENDTKWNIDTQNQYDWLVASEPKGSTNVPQNKWWEKDRTLNGKWKRPRFSRIQNKIGVKLGLCAATKTDPIMFFRHDTRIATPDLVECEILMDNQIHEVYVNDEAISTIDPENLKAWDKSSTFQFPAEGAKTIAIKASDSENGCVNGGLFMQCSSSTHPEWNFNSENSYAWKVASVASKDDHTPPQINWFRMNNNLNPNVWKRPRFSLNENIFNKVPGVERGLCGHTSTDQMMYFRYDTRKPVTSINDLVTCEILMDNTVHEVYVNDEQVFSNPEDEKLLRTWNKASTFQFPAAGAETISLKVSDNENGCETGGMFMSCKSPNHPKWNFNTENQYAWRVVSTAEKTDPEPQRFWWKKDRVLINAWKTPRFSLHKNLPGKVAGVERGLCGNTATDKMMYFRYDTRSTFHTDLVTCDILMDNKIHSVYVDGEEIFTYPGVDTDNLKKWDLSSTFQFPAPGARMMALHVEDYEDGCATGGLYMKCSSPTHKEWNLSTDNDAEKFVVYGSNSKTPRYGAWYKRNFDPTGRNGWSTPDVAFHLNKVNKVPGVTNGLCDGTNQQMWFRLNTYPECHASNCKKWDCDSWCKCFEVADENSGAYERAGCPDDDDDECTCKF